MVVLYLAREQYGFLPWVIFFLVATWASTLFFSRGIRADDEEKGSSRIPGFKREATSYLTRVMYQETLFFLLPFYWYSTVVESLNIVFSGLLLVLAVLSCVDLLFDRWLRTRPLFGLMFFATVAFGAVNLILPMLLPIDPSIGTPISSAIALGSAVPMAKRGMSKTRSATTWLVGSAALFLLLTIGFPRLVPPVPLRVQNAVFASEIDRSSLVPADSLSGSVSAGRLGPTMFLVVEVFSPSKLPTVVSLEWTRDGEIIRVSREIEIVAHDLGFKVWDGYRDPSGQITPGKYEVVLRTKGDRLFGAERIVVLSTD